MNLNLFKNKKDFRNKFKYLKISDKSTEILQTFIRLVSLRIV
jgi:hypothetical protein